MDWIGLDEQKKEWNGLGWFGWATEPSKLPHHQVQDAQSDEGAGGGEEDDGGVKCERRSSVSAAPQKQALHDGMQEKQDPHAAPCLHLHHHFPNPCHGG